MEECAGSGMDARAAEEDNGRHDVPSLRANAYGGSPPQKTEAVEGLHFMKDYRAVVDFYIEKLFAEGG